MLKFYATPDHVCLSRLYSFHVSLSCEEVPMQRFQFTTFSVQRKLIDVLSGCLIAASKGSSMYALVTKFIFHLTGLVIYTGHESKLLQVSWTESFRIVTLLTMPSWLQLSFLFSYHSTTFQKLLCTTSSVPESLIL